MSRKEDIQTAIEAVQYGDINTIKQLISNNIISSNSTDSDNCSLLHWASINNRNIILLYLIEHGANVNVLGGLLMESPLHWAIRKNYYRSVKILLQHGANVLLMSKDGITPLLLSCTIGNLEMTYFLIKHCQDDNKGCHNNDILNDNIYNNIGDSLLMTLLKEQECSKLDIFRLIIKLGCDMSFQDRQDGNNVLHVVNTRRTKEHYKLAFVLYNAAGPDALTVKNFHNETPKDVLNSTKNFMMMRFYSDYYQYANWSDHVPAVVSFFSFILFPLMIDYLGWLYGIIGYIVLHSTVLDKFLQLSIDFRYSKINQGATWGAMISFFVIFVIELQQYVHTKTTAFVYFLFITICILNILATNSEPKYVESGEDSSALIAAMINSTPVDGPLPSDPSSTENNNNEQLNKKTPLESSEVMERGGDSLLPSVSIRETEERDIERGSIHKKDKIKLDLGPEVKLCPICLVDKNLHSTHCKVCNKCLTKDFEHHCSYINNCIGENNRRVFVFFLISCFIGILTFTYLAVSIDTYVLCHNKEKYWFEWYWSIQKCMAKEHKALDVLSHVAVVMTFWLGAITYAQCAMVAFETTTFELMNDNADRECIPFERVQRNVCEFLKTGRYRVARKVNRGVDNKARWGNVVEDETQSLLADFDDNDRHGKKCTHDHDHRHDHRHGNISNNSSNQFSKYGNRYRPGSFDVDEH